MTFADCMNRRKLQNLRLTLFGRRLAPPVVLTDCLLWNLWSALRKLVVFAQMTEVGFTAHILYRHGNTYIPLIGHSDIHVTEWNCAGDASILPMHIS